MTAEGRRDMLDKYDDIDYSKRGVYVDYDNTGKLRMENKVDDIDEKGNSNQGALKNELRQIKDKQQLIQIKKKLGEKGFEDLNYEIKNHEEFIEHPQKSKKTKNIKKKSKN
jgi:hypothetical protein